MTREEAIKQIKDWDFLNETEREAIQTLVPELRETKDERIVNGIIRYLNDAMTYIPVHIDEWVTWLEEKKGQKYVCEKSLDAKFHKAEDTPYNMYFEDAQEYIGKRNFDLPWNDGEVFIDKDYLTQTVANVLRWADEHPIEKKPADDIDTVFSNREKRDTWEFVQEFVEKFGRIPKDQDELTVCVDYVLNRKTVEQNRELSDIIAEVTKDKDTATQFLKDAGIMDENGELAEMYRTDNPQPKQDWDKQQEKDLEAAAEYVRRYAEYVQGGNSRQFILDLADRIESIQLQSHWRPSEEQMEALKKNVDRLIMQYPGHKIVLESLYYDLRKL